MIAKNLHELEKSEFTDNDSVLMFQAHRVSCICFSQESSLISTGTLQEPGTSKTVKIVNELLDLAEERLGLSDGRAKTDVGINLVKLVRKSDVN